jgi:hypothetical protein
MHMCCLLLFAVLREALSLAKLVTNCWCVILQINVPYGDSGEQSCKKTVECLEKLLSPEIYLPDSPPNVNISTEKLTINLGLLA